MFVATPAFPNPTAGVTGVRESDVRRRKVLAMTTTLPEPLVTDAAALRRDLHAHPELAFEEQRTAGIVAGRLRELGLEVTTGIGGTGVVGILRGAHPGPTIMLRADMDALPMAEENDVPYASTRAGIAHACGHDGHVAMLLAAAARLRDETSALHGRLAFVFQPAEEGGGGAVAMLRDGLIGRFEIERAYGLHLVTVLPTGIFGTRPGPMMASVDTFDLVVEGRGGHGALPHLAVDPIVAAASVVTGLQQIVSRQLDPVEPAVVTVGAINGGTTYNVIPPRVALKGTVRAFSDATRDGMEARVRNVAEHACAASHATCSLSWQTSYPVTANDANETAFVMQTLRQAFGPQRTIEIPPVMASEDFSYFAREVPACFVMLGGGDDRCRYPNHHPAFDFDERALAAGIQAHVALAFAALRGGTPA